MCQQCVFLFCNNQVPLHAMQTHQETDQIVHKVV